MGVHAIDGMIDLGGEIDQVFCQSFRRVVQVDSDDTTSMLFRMKNGASGYLGTITATGPGFSFQVYGSKGSLRLEGMTHVAGASSEERRTRLFSTAKWQPIKGPAETWEAARLDVTRACLEAFGTAASGGTPFLIPTSEMVHGAAVTEAVVKSAASGRRNTSRSRQPEVKAQDPYATSRDDSTACTRRVVIVNTTCSTEGIHGFGQGPRPPHVLHAGAPDRQLGSALEERQHVSASGEGTHRAGPEVRCLPAHLGALGRAPLRGAVQARRPQESSSPTTTSISTPPTRSSTASSRSR